MKFRVSQETMNEMYEHMYKKENQHAKANEQDYDIVDFTKYVMGQIYLKGIEIQLRDSTIGYIDKNIDDARDMVHYTLFLLEALKAVKNGEK